MPTPKGTPKGKSMKWDTETKEKLFARIIQICDIKASTSLCEQLAQEMGCTAKAVSHVLAGLRKGIKDQPSSNPGSKTSTPSKRTPKPSKKRARQESSDEDDKMSFGTSASTPPTPITPTPKKRVKTTKTQSEPKQDQTSDEGSEYKSIGVDTSGNDNRTLRKTRSFGSAPLVKEENEDDQDEDLYSSGV